jgi:hypothetical protein
MQKHSFAHTVGAKIKQGRLQKGSASTANPKKNITMVEPFTWSSSMAIVFIANPSRQPLHNGLVKGIRILFYFLNWSSHCPPPCNRPLCAIAIALAALAIAHILTRHPCCHCHCPLHCRCRCLPANLVTISIALPPSPSLLLATLIVATVVAAAIALIVARPACSLPLPSLSPPLPLPLLLLTTLVAVAIALFVTSAFTCPPPLLPSRHRGWGRGGPYQSGAQSYFGRHRWCRHHCRRLCCPREWL